MRTTFSATDRVDQMFRAFSDRTRLRILCLLQQQGELCVGDIMAILQVHHQPKASQHLAHLRRAGLVVVRKAGLWSYYSLAAAAGPFHQKLLECLRCCFREVPRSSRMGPGPRNSRTPVGVARSPVGENRPKCGGRAIVAGMDKSPLRAQ